VNEKVFKEPANVNNNNQFLQNKCIWHFPV